MDPLWDKWWHPNHWCTFQHHQDNDSQFIRSSREIVSHSSMAHKKSKQRQYEGNIVLSITSHLVIEVWRDWCAARYLVRMSSLQDQCQDCCSCNVTMPHQGHKCTTGCTQKHDHLLDKEVTIDDAVHPVFCMTVVCTHQTLWCQVACTSSQSKGKGLIILMYVSMNLSPALIGRRVQCINFRWELM